MGKGDEREDDPTERVAGGARWGHGRRSRLIEDGGRITFGVDESLDDAGAIERKGPIESGAEIFRILCRAARDAEIVRRRIRRRAEANSRQWNISSLLLHFHEAQPAVVKDDDRHG